MAESNDNWFGSSWFNAAKDKLKNSEVLEFVKKDLEEFGNAVKKEANNVMSSTGVVIEKTLKLDSPNSTASSMKRSFSTFLGQMQTVLNPRPDDSDTEAIMIVEGSETIKLTRLQKALNDLQQDEKTFTTEPEPSFEKQYECWLDIIADQLTEDRISKHLNSSITLRKQHSALVPNQLNEEVFWKRYLFKKALLEDKIARQEILERKELKEKQITEDSVKWEQEDFADDIELTEEQQIKLLEQYETERKLQKKNIPNSESGGEEENVFENKLKMPIPSDTAAKKINKEDSAISLDNSSSTSSIDEEWEKINDLEK